VEEEEALQKIVRYVVAGPLAAGALLFVACSGGSAAPPTPSATATPESGLPLAVAKFRDATYRADYKLTGSPGQQFGDATLTWYKAGSDRRRFDLSSVQDGQTVNLVFVQAPDASGFCFNSSTDESGIGDLLGELTSIDAQPDATVTEELPRIVAGVAGDCFNVQWPDARSTDACISSDGVLLYMKAASGSTFEATNVAATIAEADFKLPYEVREIPGAG